MANTDAVRITNVARDHARASMDRLERHLAAGNVKGIAHEAAFLDKLNNNARREVSRVTGVAAATQNKGLGVQFLEAKAAGGASSAQVRASVLASMSEDIMRPARQTEGIGAWVWTANANACAACLLEHGTIYPAEAIFSPNHRSCHCMPDTPGLARELTDSELGSILESRGGRDAKLAEWLQNGDLTRTQLRTRLDNGAKVQRNTTPGLKSGTPKHKWSKDEIKLLDDLGPAAKKPDVVKAFRDQYPDFKGSDQSIWAKHQRTHDLLGKKTSKVATNPVAGVPKSQADDWLTQLQKNKELDEFTAPKSVQVKKVDTYVGENMKRVELWDNGTSVYDVTTSSMGQAEKLLQARYPQGKIVAVKNPHTGTYRIVMRHLDVENQIAKGQKGKLWTGNASAPKTTIPKAPAPKPAPTPQPVGYQVPSKYTGKKNVLEDAKYTDDALAPELELLNGTKVRMFGEYTGDLAEISDDVLDLLNSIEKNMIIKNKNVSEITFQYGPIKDAPGAAGLYKNGKIIVRLDGEHLANARHTLQHELAHGFKHSKPGTELFNGNFRTKALQAMDPATELSDEAWSALQYARSQGTQAMRLEEAWADLWSYYLSGNRSLLKELDLLEDFDDAARRLSYVPVKKPGTGVTKTSGWHFTDDAVRESTPYFPEVEQWAQKWISSLSYAEQSAIRTYTGSSYEAWNSALARGSHYDGNSRLAADALKKAAQYNTKPVYSWRKMRTGYGGSGSRQFIDEMDKALKTGGEVTHKPFASTTTKPGSYGTLGADGGVVLEMKSKSGAFVRGLSSFKSENEFLIAPGTRFRVVGKKEVQFKQSGYTSRVTVYQLEEVGIG